MINQNWGDVKKKGTDIKTGTIQDGARQTLYACGVAKGSRVGRGGSTRVSIWIFERGPYYKRGARHVPPVAMPRDVNKK